MSTYKMIGIDYDTFKFQSGEINVKLKSMFLDKDVTIIGSPQSSDEIMELLCLVDALRRKGVINLSLVIPYVMYSRDDRVCQEGQQLGASVFASLINSCNFTSVTTYDNHSDVITALLNNCTNRGKVSILGHSIPNLSDKYDYLVAPDAGSIKQVQELATWSRVPMLRADKTRDLLTGNITGTVVYSDDLEGKSCLIVDDICANGRTFVELAKALKAKGVGEITLYVTHLFVHKGLEELREAGISKFITTNSVVPYSISALEEVKVIKL